MGEIRPERAIVSTGGIPAEFARELEASEADGGRFEQIVVYVDGDAGPAQAVQALKDAAGSAKRKPPANIVVVVTPTVIEDTALAAFAAARSLARETAMAAIRVNSVWMKKGTISGWRAPVDLEHECFHMVEALFRLECSTGQVFVVGPSATGLPI